MVVKSIVTTENDSTGSLGARRTDRKERGA
jgi:hypothetical protein